MKVEFSRHWRAAPPAETLCPHCTMFVQLIQRDATSKALTCPICGQSPDAPWTGIGATAARAAAWRRKLED